MNPLQGLTTSTRDRESATRDLATLERMDQRMQLDQQKEMMAQQAEQEMYNRLYAQADQMLEKDRARINQRIAMMQKTVGEHLAMTGGSKADFMADGGLAKLNQFSNEIIQSDEANRYKENKKNLAKILELQEKGMGHLISPRDLKSIEDYEKNPTGAQISYNGVMAEVEIPPSELFDYGTEIPPEKIMSYNTNMIKIAGNYEKAYPDRPPLDPHDPKDRPRLVAFMREMGYGGYGSSKERMKLEYKRRMQKAKYDAENPNTGGKKSVINAYYQWKTNTPKMTMEELEAYREKGGYMKAQMNKQGGDRMTSQVIGEKFTESARRRALGHASHSFGDIGELIDGVFQDKMMLRDSYSISLTGADQQKVAQTMLDGVKLDESGYIMDFTPKESDFGVDGTRMKNNTMNVGDPNDVKGKFKFLGVTTAWKSRTGNGGDAEDILLVDALDDDGTFDKESTEKLYQREDGKPVGSEVQPTFVVALQGEEGDLVYREVNMEDMAVRTALSNVLGANDDMTAQVKANDESELFDMELEKLESQQQAKFETDKVTLDEEVFSDPIFESEGQQYFGAGSGGQMNRYDMMKAFYQAFAQADSEFNGDGTVNKDQVRELVDSEAFSMMVEPISEDLKSYEQGMTEDKLIVKWLQSINADLDEGSHGRKRNERMATLWRQILGLR